MTSRPHLIGLVVKFSLEWLLKTSRPGNGNNVSYCYGPCWANERSRRSVASYWRHQRDARQDILSVSLSTHGRIQTCEKVGPAPVGYISDYTFSKAVWPTPFLLRLTVSLFVKLFSTFKRGRGSRDPLNTSLCRRLPFAQLLVRSRKSVDN